MAAGGCTADAISTEGPSAGGSYVISSGMPSGLGQGIVASPSLLPDLSVQSSGGLVVPSP